MKSDSNRMPRAVPLHTQSRAPLAVPFPTRSVAYLTAHIGSKFASGKSKLGHRNK